MRRVIRLVLVAVLFLSLPGLAGGADVPCFGVFERAFQQAGNYENPYAEASASATLTAPDGSRRSIPLFWDGGKSWRFRFSPDLVGEWKWETESDDKGLGGKSGQFKVVPSDRKGSIRPMTAAPLHFERQDGTPFWFFGDTAWALFTNSDKEGHNRKTALEYVDARAEQGFNVLHAMLLSEAGWGNQCGPPFEDIAAERINPGYWQEVDLRLRHVNDRGVVAALFLAWGDKGRKERYAWKRLRTMDARLRYARYIAARYSAFDVFFLVAGEWHGEVMTTPGVGESAIRQQFIEIGNALHESDPHGRMIGIHPMTQSGSVREFVGAPWMSFGDYQQNYPDLHGRLLLSRKANLPLVNSEYGYYLRDMNGDGIPDKDNSFNVDDMRHATWDIVMAGGYFVTGFGTTYFGGNRDPGPFDLKAAKNDVWESQIQHVKSLFTSLDWSKLEPHDELIKGPFQREKDGRRRAAKNGGRFKVLSPPERTYWLLADPGKTCVAYVRGGKGPWQVELKAGAEADWTVRLFDPRKGTWQPLKTQVEGTMLSFQTPDAKDWVIVAERK